jgi:Xaa-Pro aminopeptidase
MKKCELYYTHSLTEANAVFYLTGFRAPDPFLCLHVHNKVILIVSEMEVGRALRERKRGVQVITPQEVLKEQKTSSGTIACIEAILDREHVEQVQVGELFPAGLYLALSKRVKRIEIGPSRASIRRRKKCAEEIACIAGAQRAAAEAMRAAIRHIQGALVRADRALEINGKALRSEDVRALIKQRLADFNCSGEEIIVAGGEQATDPHERGQGILRAGEAIILDIFPRHNENGYWGDITRTICRGPASSELRRLYKAVHNAQREALRSVRAGARADRIHARVVESFECAGYETGRQKGKPAGFIHGTGHGVGLDIHESPRVGLKKETLRAGDVITIEPGLYYPGIGGVRIEDTVLVEKGGCKLLANCVKKFEL